LLFQVFFPEGWFFGFAGYLCRESWWPRSQHLPIGTKINFSWFAPGLSPLAGNLEKNIMRGIGTSGGVDLNLCLWAFLNQVVVKSHFEVSIFGEAKCKETSFVPLQFC
jgi:hypothetical protein